MSDNGVLPELVDVDEGGALEERFARLERLVTLVSYPDPDFHSIRWITSQLHENFSYSGDVIHPML